MSTINVQFDQNPVLFDNICKCCESDIRITKKEQFLKILQLNFPDYPNSLSDCNRNIIESLAIASQNTGYNKDILLRLFGIQSNKNLGACSIKDTIFRGTDNLSTNSLGRLQLISRLNRDLRLGKLTSKYNINSNGWTRFDNIQQLGSNPIDCNETIDNLKTYWNEKFPSECSCNIDSIDMLNVKSDLKTNANLIGTFNQHLQNNNSNNNDYPNLRYLLNNVFNWQTNQVDQYIESLTFSKNTQENINEITNNDISKLIENNTIKVPSKNCTFENKILLKKALLFTNNNLGQQNKFLNIPFAKQWTNVANGKKITGQPAGQYGIQNTSQVPSFTCPNQFPDNTTVVNNTILIACRPKGLFRINKNCSN